MRRSGIALAALLLAVCGGDAPSDAAASDLVHLGVPATLAELTGPWRPEPLMLDPNMAAAVDRACRTDPEFPAGVQLVVIDARGSSKLFAAYAGPGGAEAECGYIDVAPTGEISGSLSGTSIGDRPALAAGRMAIDGGGGGSDDRGVVYQYVIGRAGAGIRRVILDVAGIGPVTATLRDGWFVAWWPVGEPIKPAGAPGPHVPQKAYTVTGYDALGQPLDQIQSP